MTSKVDTECNTSAQDCYQPDSNHDTTGDLTVDSGLLELALREGYVNLCCTKGCLIGPPGSGKTNFRALIFEEERPEERNSTDVVTGAETARGVDKACFYEDQNEDNAYGKWKSVKATELSTFIANLICHCRYDSKLNNLTDDFQDSEFLCHQSIKEINDILKSVSKGTTKIKVHLIYIVDTGGQPQFQEILPLFIRNASVNFFLFKLSEDFKSKPHFEYVLKDKSFTPPEELVLTNMEMILHSARTVYSSSYNTSLECAVKTPEKPLIILVGTFKDKLMALHQADYTEALKERQDILADKLEPFAEELKLLNSKTRKLKRCHLAKRSRRQYIYEIDGSAEGGKDNEHMLECIRGYIDEWRSKLEVHIPIRWFVFLQELQCRAQKGEAFIAIEKCYELAHETTRGNMICNEVEEALKLFDELNVILYFPEILPGVIFISPEFLYKKISEIIISTFNAKDLCGTIKEQQEEFRRSGFFKKEYMQSIVTDDKFVEGLFTKDHLLKLMGELLIIANIDNDTYFMPCVLPLHRPAEDITTQKISRGCAESLFISFKSEFSPRGLFCAMTVNLAKSEKLKIECKDESQLKRNCRTFRYIIRSIDLNYLKSDDDFGTVTVFESDELSYFKIETTCDKRHCEDILKIVERSLDQALSLLHYDSDYLDISYGFVCGCKKAEKWHLTDVNRKQLKQRCRHGRKYAALKKSQMPWFLSDESREFTLRNIKTALENLSPKKYLDLALELKLSKTSVEKHERNWPRDTERVLTEIIQEWLGTDNLASWDTLKAALKVVQPSYAIA